MLPGVTKPFWEACALRLSPSHPCRPQSAFPVGLAQKNVPQKHSTSVLFVYNTVVLGACRSEFVSINHPLADARGSESAYAVLWPLAEPRPPGSGTHHKDFSATGH